MTPAHPRATTNNSCKGSGSRFYYRYPRSQYALRMACKPSGMPPSQAFQPPARFFEVRAKPILGVPQSPSPRFVTITLRAFRTRCGLAEQNVRAQGAFTARLEGLTSSQHDSPTPSEQRRGTRRTSPYPPHGATHHLRYNARSTRDPPAHPPAYRARGRGDTTRRLRGRDP